MENHEAQKLLREQRVLIALEDHRSPVEIAQALGMVPTNEEVIIELSEEAAIELFEQSKTSRRSQSPRRTRRPYFVQ